MAARASAAATAAPPAAVPASTKLGPSVAVSAESSEIAGTSELGERAQVSNRSDRRNRRNPEAPSASAASEPERVSAVPSGTSETRPESDAETSPSNPSGDSAKVRAIARSPAQVPVPEAFSSPKIQGARNAMQAAGPSKRERTPDPCHASRPRAQFEGTLKAPDLVRDRRGQD